MLSVLIKKDTIESHQEKRSKNAEVHDFIDVYLDEMDKQTAVNPSTTFTSKQLNGSIIRQRNILLHFA